MTSGRKGEKAKLEIVALYFYPYFKRISDSI